MNKKYEQEINNYLNLPREEKFEAFKIIADTNPYLCAELINYVIELKGGKINLKDLANNNSDEFPFTNITSYLNPKTHEWSKKEKRVIEKKSEEEWLSGNNKNINKNEEVMTMEQQFTVEEISILRGMISQVKNYEIIETIKYDDEITRSVICSKGLMDAFSVYCKERKLPQNKVLYYLLEGFISGRIK